MTSTRRLILPAALAAASVLALAGALAGCASASGDAASPGTTDGGAISVVASTNVYGQIVQEIGGDAVAVTSLISSASQDPHEFEASARDQLTVQEADLIVENGGGYDPFVDAIIESSGSTAPVIVAAEYSDAWPGGEDHAAEEALADDPHAEEEHDHDHIEGFNEHVWYDPATVEKVANAIAQELGTLDPAQADRFTANAASFAEAIGGLDDALGDIDSAHGGEEVFVTEPVPGYLVRAAGLENVTPDAFSEAVEEGQDVPPATLLESITLLQSGSVSVVIVNAQTGGAETTRITDEAGTLGIPVIAFSETLPDGQTYLSWMQANIAALAGALDE